MAHFVKRGFESWIRFYRQWRHLERLFPCSSSPLSRYRSRLIIQQLEFATGSFRHRNVNDKYTKKHTYRETRIVWGLSMVDKISGALLQRLLQGVEAILVWHI